MNSDQLHYLKKHYLTKSAKRIGKDLGLSREDVAREVQVLKETEHRKKQPFAIVDSWKPRRRHHLVFSGMICLLVFALYSKSLNYPFLNWDDPKYVVENNAIRELTLARVYTLFTQTFVNLYLPVTMLSYAVDYQFSHLNARGYRLTNLAIHLGNTLLIYFLILLITQEWLPALAVALIFGVHPLQIESVIWIAERKNVLSSFFFLQAFLFYLLFTRADKNRLILYLFCFLFFVAALLSKATVVVWPVLIVAYDWTHNRVKKLRGFLKYAPFFALSLIVGLATTLVFRESMLHSEGGKPEAVGLIYHQGTFYHTVLTMTVVMVKYFKLLVFPLKQSILYEFPPYRSFFHPHVLISFLALTAAAYGLYVLYKRDRKLFFWAAWFLIAFFPYSNIIPFNVFMQERYLYLPLVGFSMVFTELIRKRLGAFRTLIFLFFCLLVFVILNVRRQEVWAVPEKLWLETQAMTQGRHSAPHHNLGMQYLRKKLPDKAIPEFEKALQVTKDPESYNGLAMAYEQKGELDKSVQYYGLVIQHFPHNAGAHNNLSIVYKKMGRYNEALAEIREAVTLEPMEPEHHNNLGTLLAKLGMMDEAEAAFKRALEIDPDDADGLYNLGMLYFAKQKFDKAVQSWENLLKLYPDYHLKEHIQGMLVKAKQVTSGIPKAVSETEL